MGKLLDEMIAERSKKTSSPAPSSGGSLLAEARARRDSGELATATRDAETEAVMRSLPATETPGFGRKVFNFFTGSSQKFGHTLGSAASVATGEAGKIDAASVSEADERFKLSKLLNDPGTPPELKASIRARLGQGPDVGVATEQISDLNKTNRQVFGEGLGTVLEATSGGGLGGVAKAKTLGQAVVQGAKVGATYGGLGSTAASMQANESLGETVKDALGGVLIGAGTGGFLGAAGYGLEKIVQKYGPQIAARRLAKQQDKVDRAVGQIGQSKKGDLAQHKEAILSLDPAELADIKTYDDLQEAVGERLTALRETQDKILASVPEPKPLDSFGQSVGAGKAEVKSNPVVSALDNLQELYEKTNDPESLSSLLSLRDKAETVGLTAAEVNQIARDYGSEFGSKAFSPRSGEALTSVNAQAYENTRKAVKESARALLPDDASKALDASMSDLLELQRAAEQVNEKVNALQNKIKERGLGEKIGRLLGQAFDIATFGTGKGFITKAFFPSGVGEKQLNYLDIQKMLPKNIKLLEAALNAGDDKLAAFVAKLVRLTEPAATPFAARKAGEAATQEKKKEEGG
jgi:hypothetical protein